MKQSNTLFEQEKDYYKPVRVGYFWNNNYIEYESNGVKAKTKGYLDVIKPYLKDVKNNLKTDI